MGARVIDGRGLAAELEEGLAAEVAGLRDAGIVPGLATVLVGSPAEAEVKNTADAARISTRAEAAPRSLETANAGGIVGTGTISIVSARGERIIR